MRRRFCDRVILYDFGYFYHEIIRFVRFGAFMWMNLLQIDLDFVIEIILNLNHLPDERWQ